MTSAAADEASNPAPGAAGEAGLTLPEDEPSPPPVRLQRVRWWSWVVPTLLALALELRWLTSRSLWQDELATRSATDRSVPELVRMLTHVDAVLGPYYLLLHAWTAVAGHGPAALRLPSAVAMAAAVGVSSGTAARLAGPAGGLSAGLLLALTPSVLLYGTEARAYAFTMLLASAATALLVRALARPTRSAWVAYAACLVLLGWTQVTALGLAPAHLLALAVAGRWSSGRLRGARRPAAWCTVAAATAALPFVAMGHRQAHQVAWIPQPTPGRVLHLFVDAFESRPLGWTVIVLAALTGAFGARRLFSGPAGQAPGDGAVPGPAFAVLLGGCLAVVPVLTLAAVSLVTPVTLPRYALPTVTGWALIVACLPILVGRLAAVAQVRRFLPATVAVLLTCTVLAVGWSGRAAVGAPTRAEQPDFRPLAAALAGNDRPGDAIVVPTDAGRRFRIGLQAYLGDAPWPQDVLVRQPAARADRLDARECAPATCLGHPARLWVGCVGRCTSPTQALSPETRAVIRAAGYRPVRTWRAGSGSLTLMVAPGQG